MSASNSLSIVEGMRSAEYTADLSLFSPTGSALGSVCNSHPSGRETSKTTVSSSLAMCL